MKNILNSLKDLFFPPLCFGCNGELQDGEKLICTECRFRLQTVDSRHLGENQIIKLFRGRCSLQAATALFYFQKGGLIQKLLHQLKYNGYQELCEFFGNWLGSEMKEWRSVSCINLVVPVPLHPKRYKKRGYNQVSTFAKSISKHLNSEYREDVLEKVINVKSKVSKGREERWGENPFRLKKSISDRDILLVDGMITTGNTIQDCVEVLNENKSNRISVCSIAIGS